MKQIKITIDPMGVPKVDAIGFKGANCADATKVIEKALAGGAGEMSQVMKPEWHETEDIVQVAEVNAGW